MDSFDDAPFLAKEWLVKVDAQTSTPYLLKFYSSPVDLTCSVMVTDTKRTWAEVLSSKQFARRWRECNTRVDSPLLDDEEEDAWRARFLALLSSAHTLGGMPELSFEVVDCKYGDFAIQLECNAFKWRWEAFFVGYRASADILSKHLIMPLISLNHLAFSSPDVVGDLPPVDLEKSVDKVARTARRTLDIHVKNALSKPRLATTIRRITAVFNFISDPPHVLTEVDPPVLLAPPEPVPKIKRTPERLKITRSFTPEPTDRHDVLATSRREPAGPSGTQNLINHATNSGSATEPEDDSSVLSSKQTPGPGADQRPDAHMRSRTPSGEVGSPRSRNVTRAPSDTDSSPVRPIKKSKPRASSSDGDSEEERKKLAAQIRSGTASAPGLRQPFKRGGKRF